MGQKNTVASLEIELLMATASAVSDLARFGGQVDRTTAESIKQLDRIDAAMKGVGAMANPSAKMVEFAAETARTATSAAREFNRIEQAGERMAAQLERQLSTFGKTAGEVRSLKAEAAALAAQGKGMDELARRIRDTDQALRGLEGAASPVGRGFGAVGTSGKLAGHHMQNLAFQFQDLGVQMVSAAGSSDPLKMGLMALMQQGAQINGVMSQAGIGIRGVGAAFADMSKSILLATVTNPAILATAAAIAVVAGSIKYMQGVANDGAPMKAYAASLGLTAKEMRELDSVTVTFGDTTKAVFQVAGAAIWEHIGPAVTSTSKLMKEWLQIVASDVKDAVNFMIGGFVGGYNAIRKTWAMFPAVMGDIFYSAVNASIGGINAMVRGAIDGINALAAQANKILPEAFQIPTLGAGQIASVKNQYAGAMREAGKAGAGELQKALGADYVGAGAGAVIRQAIKNSQDRNRAEALEKGYLDDNNKVDKPDVPKMDRRAEQMARDAEAIEAQIKNLYALADAYGVSGAAALIAEARVKAESEAIKKRGDVEEFVNRQVRLSIATRVSDAAKATAAVREQADAQDRVNTFVAAGLLPAERASELVKDRIADLPLLAAIEAAQMRGLTTEADRATKALADQRREQQRLRAAEEQGRFDVDMAAGRNRLAELQEELRLVGATDDVRVRALATLKATQEATTKFEDLDKREAWIAQQAKISDLQMEAKLRADAFNDSLRFQADLLDEIAANVSNAAGGLADAFGEAGRALGDMASLLTGYLADQRRLQDAKAAELRIVAQIKDAEIRGRREREIGTLYATRSATAQIGLFGDMTGAAKSFFKEGSDGYKALATAEKVFRAVEFAMSVRAMAQDAIETGQKLASSAARTAASAVEAVAKAIASLPFPANLAAGAATIAALAAIGVSIAGSFGGGKNDLAKANSGTGTVLGDTSAKSESIKRSIDALKEVDLLMLSTSRQMASSLRSIESQIGGIATLVVRAGDVNASAGVTEGFKANMVGSVLGAIPVIGGILKGLFGTSTKVVGGGLYGGSQSLGSILDGGFDASTYSDVQKKKKLFGFTTSTKFKTEYGAADPTLENQFTLILRSFNSAITAAAGPLGLATGEVEARLRGFVVNIGKIDLKDLTGAEIQEKLSAVFGAAADSMAAAAFPGLEKFQRVGEGAFETLVRVSSTVEQVTASLDQLGASTRSLGMEAKLGLADQFDSIGDFANAVDAYFSDFFTQEEQAAAKAAQFGRVFDSLGLGMPATLAGFRGLVEAQDLTTEAGRATYATLLQLAPAFADLKSAMDGAKSAADILSERQDLQRRLLELNGDTAAIRALDLAKLDASNRALQGQIYALQDAQEAAKAADELRKAWSSVSDSIMDEVRRIRGLSDAGGSGSFASLMGQFNAANASARAGDMDAAKSLPGLSQALLSAAALVATSRQELNRVQAQTAASLEATNAALAGSGSLVPAPASTASLLGAVAASQAASTSPAASNDDLIAEMKALRSEVVKSREDNNAGHAATASNTGKAARTLEAVTAGSGGEAIAVANAA